MSRVEREWGSGAIAPSGGTIDVQAIFELVGKYADFPEMMQLVTFVEQDSMTAMKQGASMPAHTTREYIRRGGAGPSMRGQEAMLQQSLLSGAPESGAVPEVR